MAVTELLYKSAHFTTVDDWTGSVHDDFGNKNFAIPVISATKSEVQSAYNSTEADMFNGTTYTLNTNWAALLALIHAEFSLMPFVSQTQGITINYSVHFMSDYRNLRPGVSILDWTAGSILKVEYGNLGLMIQPGSSTGLKLRNTLTSQTDLITSPVVPFVSVISAASTSLQRGKMGFWFFTSDGYLGIVQGRSGGSTAGSKSIAFASWGASSQFITWMRALPDPGPEDTDDPYKPGGESGSGGGTGTFSETGDTIGIPGLPALSAVDTGFITLFNPSAAQVKSLAAYMWSSSFDLATFKNIVANPIDCILGLSIVPVNPPNAGSKAVTVGNIPTDVTLPYLSSQYVEVDCGTLNVQEFWGSYLDYSPYTKMSLYLPYIGIIPLDIDDVMNASIAIKYHVDVLSGACVAYVLCNGTQLYTYVGQCSSNVPITSNDFTNTVNGILGIAGSIGKLAADGGASAPTELSGIAANAINALKPNIQKSGAMSGTGGLMGVQTPYLICQRPRQSVPAYQNSFTGYPANITAKLSDLSGYTEVDSIHLDGLSATKEEQQEIMGLLTSGVII